jgi:hypothetical protein
MSTRHETIVILDAPDPISPTTGQPFKPFRTGQLVATPGAMDTLILSGTGPVQLVMRHHRGDWGDISPEDHGANERATYDGSRLLSVYKLEAGTVWVITDAEDDDGKRHATTLLLPSEY